LDHNYTRRVSEAANGNVPVPARQENTDEVQCESTVGMHLRSVVLFWLTKKKQKKYLLTKSGRTLAKLKSLSFCQLKP